MGVRTIFSRWTTRDYVSLVESIQSRGLTFSPLQGYAKGLPGIWLRHDVELSLQAALAMAAVEKDLNIPSAYFVCAESPFLSKTPKLLAQTLDELLELGRTVSYHIVLSSEVGSVTERLERLARRFPSIQPQALTFHAPGVGVEALALAPLGGIVYRPLAQGFGRYFSDSTGRWRWGDPRSEAIGQSDTVQLLTHPFWWSGVRSPASLSGSGSSVATFLPQFSALELTRSGDGEAG